MGLGPWLTSLNQFDGLGIMFERHGLEEFEKAVSPKQADSDSIKRIHEACVAIEEIPPLSYHNKYFY